MYVGFVCSRHRTTCQDVALTQWPEKICTAVVESTSRDVDRKHNLKFFEVIMPHKVACSSQQPKYSGHIQLCKFGFLWQKRPCKVMQLSSLVQVKPDALNNAGYGVDLLCLPSSN